MEINTHSQFPKRMTLQYVIQHTELMTAIRNTMVPLGVKTISAVTGFLPPNKYNRDYYNNGHESGASAITYFCYHKSIDVGHYFPTFEPISWSVDSPPKIAYYRDMGHFHSSDFEWYLITLVIQKIKQSYPPSTIIQDGFIFNNGRLVQYCRINAPDRSLAIWNAMNNSKNIIVRKSQYACVQSTPTAALIDTSCTYNGVEYNVRVKSVLVNETSGEWITI
tara:strand:- start:3622 stop:4284 length:663 start_codon:yes stop_codon:yes gene_type:complete